MTDNQATALHGSITGLLFNGTGIATYTNNGDGALTDSFVLLDEDSDEVHFAVTVLPPASNFSVLPASLPAPVISVPYSQTLTASGGVAPYTYTVAPGSLPAGLSLSSGGVLSGTATATGSFSVVVDVSDSTPGTALTDTKNYSVTVAIPTQSLSSSGTPPGGVLSTAYSHQFSTVGGTPPYIYQFHSGTPPPGLTLSSTGTLSGTPTTAGDYTFKVQSTDSTGGLGPYPQVFPVDLKINAGPPPIVGAVNATIVPGSSANPITLNISGGALSVAVSSAPSHGMTSASGTSIYYTPNVGYTGPDSFAYTATNANGTSNPAIVTLSVVGVPDAPTVGSVTAGDTTASVSFTPAANNGGTPVSSYTVISSPGGFTGSGAGSPVTVTGLTNGATYNFTVTATNSQGTSGSSAPSNSVTPQAPAPVVSSISPARGPTAGGNSVVITGSGFSDVTSVKFGGTASTAFAVNSPTQITAIAPAGSGTIDITVVMPGGTSATSGADQYTYVAAPTVSSISPSSGASGTNVTLTGTGFTGATAVTFGATAASGFTFVSATQITATAPAGSGTVDIRVTTAGGTSSTSASDQFTYSVVPTVTSVSPNSGPAAGGTNVTINGTGFSPVLYVYFGGTRASFTVGSATQITATAPAGSGTVDVTVETTSGTSLTSPADQFTYEAITAGPVSSTVAYGSSANLITLPLGGAVTSVSLATGPEHGTAVIVGNSISYTPTAGYAGPDSMTYTATNGVVTTAPATITLIVAPPTLATTPGGPWTATSGQAFSKVLTFSGGMAPYSGVSVTGLPPGLSSSASATGVTISGTPTQSGSFPVSVSMSDSSTGHGPFTQQNTFALTVDGAQALALSPGGTTFNATQDSVFTQVFSASGGIAPYTFTQTGSLPAGVSWNGASATLSGTPTASGAFPFSIQVTDSSSGTPISTAQNYTLQVANVVPVAPPQSVASAGPGEPVEVNLTANATGGPFTAATVLTVAPASAGSATISVAGASAARRQLRAVPSNNYVLRFVPNPDASGVVTVTYSLTNANALMANGVVTISLTSRGDPSKDAEVQGLLNAQANSSRRFASGQISNFQQRLEALHAGNVSAFSNGFTLSSASLQRQRLRQNQNDDPTGIEQWMQIQNAKLNADQSLRTRTLSQQARELKPASAGAEGPELGNQSASAATSPLAFWTSGTISIGDDSTGSSAQSQEFVTSGLSVGADYRLASNLTVGLGFGYGHDKTDIGNNGSRSQADSYSVAVYGSYRPIQNIYLDAVLGYQRLSFDNRRYVTDNAGMVTGDRDGGQTFASLAAGYEFREENWLVSPYARLDLAHAKLDSYRERGDNLFALNYDQQTVKTTSTSLGVRGEFARSTSIGDLTPSLRLEYQHDFQGTGDASMRYADTGDGALYRISLDPLGQDRGVMGVGLGLLTAAQWSLNTEYQYTISSGSQKAQTLLFSLRKPF